MSVMLEIEDGNPWWESPNLWVVPGNDPQGPPGVPVAGEQAFLWAHVRNVGNSGVNNATVRFYWANPAIGFDRTTATIVGTSFVTLDAGAESDVLCLVPWVPSYVNGGHECILGEAFDPLTDPLPLTAAFNVPTDRHVAQRNLAVLMAHSWFHFPFEIHNTSRLPRTFVVEARQAELSEIDRLNPTLGEYQAAGRAERKIKALALVTSPCPVERERKGQPHAEVKLAGNARTGLTVVGELESGAALLRVTQSSDGRVIGGASVLVLGKAEKP